MHGLDTGSDEAGPSFKGRANVPGYRNGEAVSGIGRNVSRRISKAVSAQAGGVKKFDEMDHNDASHYVPLTNTETVTQACHTAETGKSHLTVEGYANSVPGFSQYIKTLAKNGNVEKLSQAVKSYVRFESIIMGNYKKGQKGYIRFNESIMNRRTVVSQESPRVFIKELNEMVTRIAKAYGEPKLINSVKLIFSDTNKMDKIQAAIDNFDRMFDAVTRSDKGRKFLATVRGAKLTSITSIH